MTDDLERQLDEFYRKLDGSARRVEARWKATPARESRAVAAWLGAGVAAAAAILLLISALRTEPRRTEEPVVRVAPPPPVTEPAPRPLPAPPAPTPKSTPPTPVEPTPRAPEPRKPELPTPEPQTPEPRKPTPPPAPETKPEPPKSEGSAPTQVARASVKLTEAEGTFELTEKGVLRGKQKELKVGAGDRLRASTLVKITLGDDRTLLLAPKSVLEFRPEEKRLSVSLDQGELIADLVAPGPELRVVTRTCEVVPQGAAFDVKVDVGRVMVMVERGRVEVQSPKGRAALRPGEALQASEDGTLGTPVPADFRSMGWARSHRAPEMTLYSEDFSKPGAWWGEIDRGAARAVSKAGAGPTVQITVEKPGLFEVPLRGALTIVCRADRAARIKIQLYSPDLKTTYTKLNIPVLRGERWVPITIDFDELQPSDKSKPSRMTPGSMVTDLLVMYGDEPGPGNFWVDSIKVTELRP